MLFVSFSALRCDVFYYSLRLAPLHNRAVEFDIKIKWLKLFRHVRYLKRLNAQLQEWYFLQVHQ